MNEPQSGIGQFCVLCENVHDLLSACPPPRVSGNFERLKQKWNLLFYLLQSRSQKGLDNE